jgi:Fe-S cluster biogenesis protein NfuA/nitrite reductase/ring-hydroxylating ferredoxin subunit
VPGTSDTREIGARVEHLLADIATVADAAVQEKAEELARALVELYGAGLERVVELLAGQPDGERLVGALAADEFVASLLILHGLHPVPVADRVQAALDQVRPYLGSHAGGVEFLGIDDDGVARLSLQGSCDGCPSSTVTVKLAIERAIEAAAPELTGIEVAGVVAEEPAAPKLLQIGRPPGSAAQPYQERSEPGWFALPDLHDLPAGGVRAVEVEGVRLAVCRADAHLYAYRDACPRCGSSLAGARLEGHLLTCPGCARRYDVRLAGRGEDVAHLDPVPLVGDEQRARVALPAGVGT